MFKQIGSSDYKARFNFMNLFAVADGRPSSLCGTILLEEHVTPLKNTRLVLRKKDGGSVLSNSATNHVGRFDISVLLPRDSYLLEVESADYIGKWEVAVEPDRVTCYEVTVQKRL